MSKTKASKAPQPTRKWRVHATVTAGKYLGVVEAATKEEAQQKGWNLSTCYCSVCHQCARQVSDPEVSELHVEEAEADEVAVEADDE